MKNYFFNKYELSNGIEVYVNSTHQFITTTMRLGFYIPLTKEAGKTATLASVLLKGSESYPTLQDIGRRLADLKDASIIPAVEKHGHLQEMCFEMNALTEPVYSGEESPFDITLEVLEDILTRPYLEAGVFSNKYVQQAKDNLEKTIIELVNNKKEYASKMLYKGLYPDNSYGLSVHGSLEDIKQIDKENLYDYYKKIVSSTNIKIFITGSKSEEEYLNQLERHFSRLPRRKEDFKELLAIKPSHELNLSREPKHEKMEGVNESQLFLVYQHSIDRRDETNHPALILYNGLLGVGTNGLLFKAIRGEHSLAYSARSSLNHTLKLIGCYAGLGDHTKYEKAVGLIKEQVDQLRRGKFANKDVVDKRDYLISMSKQSLDSPDERIDKILDLVLNDVFDLQDYSFSKLKAVKKKDVQRVAEMIDPDKNFIYFLRPK